MSILVTTDWQLDDQPANEYRHRVIAKLPAIAKKHGAETIMILGDLTEEKDCHPARLVNAMVAHWVFEAPWSSEVVHSYSLVVAHLRADFFKAPVIKYVAGATHELALIAIHPMADRDAMLRAPTDMDVAAAGGLRRAPRRRVGRGRGPARSGRSRACVRRPPIAASDARARLG